MEAAPSDLPFLVANALLRAEGMRRLSFREQSKTSWRLSRFFRGTKVDYRRMRGLLLFGMRPLSEEEASFATGWKEYRALLETGGAPVGHRGDEPFQSYLSRAIASCAADDPLVFFGLLNGTMLKDGFWPVRLTNAGEVSARGVFSGDAAELLKLMLLTPLQEERYVAGLRPLSAEDVLRWIREEVLANPWVVKAFLMGSFHFRDELPDSDIDLGVSFAEGLTEEEKRGEVGRLRSQCLRSLSRTADVKEVLLRSDGTPIGVTAEAAEEVVCND